MTKIYLVLNAPIPNQLQAVSSCLSPKIAGFASSIYVTTCYIECHMGDGNARDPVQKDRGNKIATFIRQCMIIYVFLHVLR